MIDLCTLGTGGTLPMPERALSSLYVRVNGRILLIDCGEGTQVQVRKCGWGFIHVDAILLTHYHGDHCSGLPGFLLSIAKTHRTEPVHIYGPVGLRSVYQGLMVIAPTLTFPVVLHELRGGEEFEAIGMQVRCFPVHHGVPCLGYRFALARQAAFDPQKARALNIPVTQWKLLQRGERVMVDSRLILPEEVTGAPRKGLSFLYATDTRPVPALIEQGAGTDLLILEGMYGDDDKIAQAHKNHHMIFHEAAEIALAAGAKRLLLTHYSTCIEDPLPYLPLAQEVFPETACAEDVGCLRLVFEER